MNLHHARDGWNDRRQHPEAPARTGVARLRHALLMGRWGAARVQWLPGEDGRVPGTDRPWQRGDRVRVRRRTWTGRTRTHVSSATGIDEALATDLNWGFRWTQLPSDERV